MKIHTQQELDESIAPISLSEAELVWQHPGTRRVLDQGFVRMVDHMGGDLDILQAARVSYAGTELKRTNDRGLLRYLMRNRHTTPFEMVELKFHVKAPIYVFRQWHRHRTASINEMSGRYSVLPDQWHVIPSYQWRLQSQTNKQGSSGSYIDMDNEGIKYTMAVEKLIKADYELYHEMVDAGVAKEIARNHLPLSTYSEMYWKTNLHNFLHFSGLRSDSHAQLEIRQYSDIMVELVKDVVPMAVEAWEDYVFNAVTFSLPEQRALEQLFKGAGFLDFGNNYANYGLSKREVSELSAKIERIAKGI